MPIRLQAFQFKLKFPTKIDDIKPDIETFKNAVKELKESKKLYRLLSVILQLGNFINGGTFRGDCAGFKIDALLKVKSNPCCFFFHQNVAARYKNNRSKIDSSSLSYPNSGEEG